MALDRDVLSISKRNELTKFLLAYEDWVDGWKLMRVDGKAIFRAEKEILWQGYTITFVALVYTANHSINFTLTKESKHYSVPGKDNGHNDISLLRSKVRGIVKTLLPDWSANLNTDLVVDLYSNNFEEHRKPLQTTRQAMIATDERTLIVCSAAMSPAGKVVCSIRHGDEHFYNQVDNGKGVKHYHDWVQGFVTNTGAFVTREEAWVIAERQGQIRNKLPCDSSKELYSENLY